MLRPLSSSKPLLNFTNDSFIFFLPLFTLILCFSMHTLNRPLWILILWKRRADSQKKNPGRMMDGTANGHKNGRKQKSERPVKKFGRGSAKQKFRSNPISLLLRSAVFCFWAFFLSLNGRPLPSTPVQKKFERVGRKRAHTWPHSSLCLHPPRVLTAKIGRSLWDRGGDWGERFCSFAGRPVQLRLRLSELTCPNFPEFS